MEDCGRSFDAELLAAALRFEDALGDEEETCAGFEGLDSGFEGEVGEEPKGHGDVAEDAGAVAVAKDGGLAAGVDVGEESVGEIEAAEEGGGEAGSVCGVIDGLVDFVGEGGESVGHIDAVGEEELGGAEAKGVLCGGCDGVGVGAVTGDVGEEEDDVGTGGYGVEEVAAGAEGVVPRVQIEFVERRQSRWQRSAGGLGGILHGWWRLYFVWREWPEYFCWIFHGGRAVRWG